MSEFIAVVNWKN